MPQLVRQLGFELMLGLNVRVRVRVREYLGPYARLTRASMK